MIILCRGVSGESHHITVQIWLSPLSCTQQLLYRTTWLTGAPLQGLHTCIMQVDMLFPKTLQFVMVVGCIAKYE